MNRPVIALIVATLTCGSASAYLWQELRTEREQARILQTRVAELEKMQATPPAPRIDEPPTSVIEPVGAPEPTASSNPPTPAKNPTVAFVEAASPGVIAMTSPAGPGRPGGPEMRRLMQDSFEQQQRLLKDPEYRELMRAQQKLHLERMYGDMEVMLGLSQEDADRVRDVLAEQQLRSMEQRPFMAMSMGEQPDQAQIREQQRAFEETRRRNDAELAAALGPKFSEWQEYQNNMWPRTQVTRLRETLAGSDEPLRQDQIKPLVTALAREQQHMQMTVEAGGRLTPETQLRMQEEWLERTAQSHERIRNSVSSLLSPSQLQRLQDQQEQERRQQELNLRIQRARADEARARGEDPTGEAMLAVPAIR